MSDFVVYGAEDVTNHLDMDGCIAAVRHAMAEQTRHDLSQPLRNILPMGPGKLFALMPGELPTPDAFGAKIVTAFADPQNPGRAAHRGVVVVFNRESGAVECIADAREVTEIRTAAASAVATDALARADSSRLAIFGYGAQAHSHVHAISRVRKLDDVVIWGRSRESADAFAARLGDETGLPIRVELDAAAAAAGADIICTVTGSATPVLLGEWVRPGTHVNAVGSSHAGPVEVDQALVVASRYIADNRRSVLAAGAEFLNARDAGVIGDNHIVAEIGEVLLGRVPGRTADDEITFYKSLGHVIQDLAAARYLHKRASGRGAAEAA